MQAKLSSIVNQALGWVRCAQPWLDAVVHWGRPRWRRSMFLGLPLALALILVARMLMGPAMPARARGGLAVNLPPRAIADVVDPQPRMSKAAVAMQEWTATPIAPLTRNFFAVNLDYFPQASGHIDPALRLPQGSGFWDELEKSMLSRAEEKNVRQKLIDGLRQEAAQLHLQSIMMGPQPKAMINGALVSEGDSIASFRVVKVTARGIIIEREGIKLEISI